jgi:hypothetical protein
VVAVMSGIRRLSFMGISNSHKLAVRDVTIITKGFKNLNRPMNIERTNILIKNPARVPSTDFLL